MREKVMEFGLFNRSFVWKLSLGVVLFSGQFHLFVSFVSGVSVWCIATLFVDAIA